MKKVEKKNIITIALLLIVMILSICVLSKMTTKPEFYAKTIASLDEKKATVLKLTAASTATATALAAVPGDATSPIANKIADVTSYFVIILMVIFVEKYLVVLMGYVSFLFLIPVACLIGIVGIIRRRRATQIIAIKIAITGMVLFAVIPASIQVSNVIENTYESSVNTTLKSVKKTTDEIDDAKDKDGNVILKVINKFKGGVNGVYKKGEKILNRFIESIAVMLATSCAIPLGVIFFTMWLIKMLFGVEVSIPKEMQKKDSTIIPRQHE